MGPLVYLCLALGAMNIGTYGYMAIKQKIVVGLAVSAERDEGVRTCNVRVGAIEKTHNDKVGKSTAEARKAADLVPDPPETDTELAALCKKSASCRSRGAL